MKIWLVLAVTCIWWAAIVGPAAWVCSSSLSVTGGGHDNNLSFDQVEFRVNGCTKKSYSDFVQSLRRHLSSGTRVHEILLLPARYGSLQDLLLVQLFDWGDAPITLVLNRVNACVIAYQAQNRYYLLADTSENPELYGSNPIRLSFTGSYIELERAANLHREKIYLGMNDLARAIATLHFWSPPTVESSVARSLIVLIQMVSETARFGEIEQRVIETIFDKQTPIQYGSFYPSIRVMNFEINWETLSTAVQSSNEKGEFVQPVELQVTSHSILVIKNVEKAREFSGLALLLYLCQSQASLSSHDF